MNDLKSFRFSLPFTQHINLAIFAYDMFHQWRHRIFFGDVKHSDEESVIKGASSGRLERVFLCKISHGCINLWRK